MICPRCGAECERDEADVGIGTIGGAWGCPECHWVDSASQELFQAMDEGQGAKHRRVSLRVRPRERDREGRARPPEDAPMSDNEEWLMSIAYGLLGLAMLGVALYRIYQIVVP